MKLTRLLNVLAHIGLGAWSGATLNDPQYRHGGWGFVLTFLAYQGLGAWRKRDKGYPEVKEFMIGMGAALLLRRALGDR